MAPSASIIIPAYNAGRLIARAISSALAQTLSDIEVIVVNDGSRDDTAEVVERLMTRDRRVRLLQNEGNFGPGFSRNRAIAVASGKWVAILDADDAYHPRRLAYLIDVAERVDADAIADIPIFYRQRDGRFHQPRLSPKLMATGGPLNLHEFLQNAMPYGTPDIVWIKPIVRRNFLSRGIQYAEDLYLGEDFLFFLTCFAAGWNFYVEPKSYYFANLVGGSLSRSTDTKARYRDLLAANRSGIRLLEQDAVGATMMLLKWREWLIKASIKSNDVRQQIQARKYVNAAKSFVALSANPAAYVKYSNLLFRGASYRWEESVATPPEAWTALGVAPPILH